MDTEQQWIRWIRELHAISQNGLVHTKNPFDIERYERLGEIAREMYAVIGDAPVKKIEDFFLPDRGYCTPKVDLRAGIFEDDRILLVREKSDGKWTMPEKLSIFIKMTCCISAGLLNKRKKQRYCIFLNQEGISRYSRFIKTSK